MTYSRAHDVCISGSRPWIVRQRTVCHSARKYLLVNQNFREMSSFNTFQPRLMQCNQAGASHRKRRRLPGLDQNPSLSYLKLWWHPAPFIRSHMSRMIRLKRRPNNGTPFQPCKAKLLLLDRRPLGLRALDQDEHHTLGQIRSYPM